MIASSFFRPNFAPCPTICHHLRAGFDSITDPSPLLIADRIALLLRRTRVTAASADEELVVDAEEFPRERHETVCCLRKLDAHVPCVIGQT